MNATYRIVHEIAIALPHATNPTTNAADNPSGGRTRWRGMKDDFDDFDDDDDFEDDDDNNEDALGSDALVAGRFAWAATGAWSRLMTTW